MSKAIDIAIPLVKHFEGLYLTTYLCPASKETIGYGHTGHDVVDGMHITEQEANALLDADLHDAENDVDDLVTVPLADYEKAALISFVFNLGGHALESSTLLRVLNEGNRQQATLEFLRWDKATVRGVKVPLRGLTLRRKAESCLFATGKLVLPE